MNDCSRAAEDSDSYAQTETLRAFTEEEYRRSSAASDAAWLTNLHGSQHGSQAPPLSEGLQSPPDGPQKYTGDP